MFNWQAFSAIGTWVAIMVALFIPYWQNRRRLILRIIPNRCAILNVNEVIPYIETLSCICCSFLPLTTVISMV